jgi:hypothetical protein
VWECGVPCAGFVIEGQREALERRGTWRELERAADALCELALDARLFSVRARRARRQALELLVQSLRFLPVLQRERRAAVNGTRRDRRRSKGEGKHELWDMHGDRRKKERSVSWAKIEGLNAILRSRDVKEGKRKTENEEKGSDLAVGCSDIL